MQTPIVLLLECLLNISILFSLDIKLLLLLIAPLVFLLITFIIVAALFTLIELHIHVNDFLASLDASLVPIDCVVHELLGQHCHLVENFV
jgi:hypothetical protein